MSFWWLKESCIGITHFAWRSQRSELGRCRSATAVSWRASTCQSGPPKLKTVWQLQVNKYIASLHYNFIVLFVLTCMKLLIVLSNVDAWSSITSVHLSFVFECLATVIEERTSGLLFHHHLNWRINSNATLKEKSPFVCQVISIHLWQQQQRHYSTFKWLAIHLMVIQSTQWCNRNQCVQGRMKWLSWNMIQTM